MKRAEDHYFAGLTVLLFVTYLDGGHFRTASPTAWVALGAVAFLFRVLAGFLAAWSLPGPKAGLAAPLAYLLLQTGSAGLAVYSTSFYAFGLAMHYVEYHVLMVSRCFHAPLDPSIGVDRMFARLRSHKVLFYATLLGLAALVLKLTWAGMSSLVRADLASTGTTSSVLLAACSSSITSSSRRSGSSPTRIIADR